MLLPPTMFSGTTCWLDELTLTVLAWRCFLALGTNHCLHKNCQKKSPTLINGSGRGCLHNQQNRGLAPSLSTHITHVILLLSSAQLQT